MKSEAEKEMVATVVRLVRQPLVAFRSVDDLLEAILKSPPEDWALHIRVLQNAIRRLLKTGTREAEAIEQAMLKIFEQ